MCTQSFFFTISVFRYKLLMAEFKASVVRFALKHYLEHPSGAGYQFGDLVELNAHLARTAAKLHQRHFSFARETLQLLQCSTEHVRAALAQKWDHVLKEEKAEQQIDLQSLMAYVSSSDVDLPNPMKQANTVISQALTTDNVLESMRSSRNPFKDTPPGHQVLHNIPSDATFTNLRTEINCSGSRPEDMERALQAVEIFIRIRLWPRSSGSASEHSSPYVQNCCLVSLQSIGHPAE